MGALRSHWGPEEWPYLGVLTALPHPSGTVGGVALSLGRRAAWEPPAGLKVLLPCPTCRQPTSPTWGYLPLAKALPAGLLWLLYGAPQGPAGTTHKAWWEDPLPQLHMQENRGWHVSWTPA